MGQNRYPKKCYMRQIKLDEQGKENWSSGVRKLVSKLGLFFAWMSQSVGEEKQFMHEVKDRLTSISWEELNLSEKEFISSKSTIFEHTPYVHLMHSYSTRRMIALISCKGLPINDNLKRINMKHNDRCVQCNLKEVEDEFHVICVCPKYADMREKCLKPKYIIQPNEIKFASLLKSTNYEEITELAGFVHYLSRERFDNTL